MKKMFLFCIGLFLIFLTSCGVTAVASTDDLYDIQPETTIVLENGTTTIVYYYDDRYPHYYWYFDATLASWRWHYFVTPPVVWHHWPHHRPFFGHRGPVWHNNRPYFNHQPSHHGNVRPRIPNVRQNAHSVRPNPRGMDTNRRPHMGNYPSNRQLMNNGHSRRR